EIRMQFGGTMDTLLILAIIVITLSIAVEAGILVAMYLLSRRVANNVNGLVNESHKLMAPMERVAVNFKSTSEDVAHIGKHARRQIQHAMTPVREWSAIATGVTVGLKTFFKRRKTRFERVEEDIRRSPAARFTVAAVYDRRL